MRLNDSACEGSYEGGYHVGRKRIGLSVKRRFVQKSVLRKVLNVEVCFKSDDEHFLKLCRWVRLELSVQKNSGWC